MKKRSKKKIIAAALLFTALLGSALAISYSWFINNREVGIHSDKNMSITVGTKLEISESGNVVDGDKWGSSVQVGIKDKTCPDISGDGINFYFPTTLTPDDEPTYDLPQNFKHINNSTNPDDYYISVKLKFRTNTPMEVYLSNVSDILGEKITIGENGEYIFEDDDLTSTAPSGAIAGAIRVGFSEEISTTDESGNTSYYEVLRSIWIPNDKYELQPGVDFLPNGSRETEYYYLSPDNGMFNSGTKSMVVKSWTLDDYASGKILVGKDRLASNDNGILSSNGSTPLLTFNCEGGALEEKTLIIRIWIEGTDREAHTNLNGGKIQYNLDFLGISKSDYTQEEKDIYNSINADNSGLYTLGEEAERVAYDNAVPVDYSFNGIDWQSYDPTVDNLGDLFAGHQNVCIRMSETENKNSNSYRKISLIN